MSVPDPHHWHEDENIARACPECNPRRRDRGRMRRPTEAEVRFYFEGLGKEDALTLLNDLYAPYAEEG